jgi:hypothetical protein
MNKKHSAIYLSFMLGVILITLTSCIGLSMNIQMNKDGSGKLTMEYRISKMMSSLGALDGNESMPTIPVGKTDWERTVDRVPGAELISFSSTEDSPDIVTKIVIEYKDEQALISLLDPLGKRTTIDRQGQSGKIDLIILDDANAIDESNYDKDILDLMRVFWEGYNFSVNFSGPGNSTLTVTDGEGNTIPAQAAAKTTLSGKSVSYSTGIMELLELKGGLGFKFTW